MNAFAATDIHYHSFVEASSMKRGFSTAIPGKLGRIFNPGLCTIYLIFAYFIYFSALTVMRHQAFMTQSFDLSVYVQMLWNSLHGDFFRVTIQPGRLNYLQHHFAPSMALFIPLYWIWTDPRWLLILQTGILASGAWPIYKIASQHIEDRRMGVVFALVYLLFPSIQGANLYDFHEITIAAPLLAWAWYFGQEKKWILFGGACALALGFREEVVIFTVGMGLVLLFKPATRRAGIILIFTSLAWLSFLMAVSFYQRNYNMNASLYFQSRFELGVNPVEALKNMLGEPGLLVDRIFIWEKFSYLIRLFAPVGFLLFLSWEWLFLVFPLVGLYLLGSFPMLLNPAQGQYNVLIVPFIVICAVYGSTRMQRKLSLHRSYPNWFWNSILAIFILLLAFGYQMRLAYLPISPYFKWPRVYERHLIASGIANGIPVEASLSVQDNLAPHASHRRDLYIFPEIHQAAFIFLDLQTMQELKSSGVMDLTPDVQAVLSAKNYETVVDQAGFLLLKRK